MAWKYLKIGLYMVVTNHLQVLGWSLKQECGCREKAMEVFLDMRGIEFVDLGWISRPSHLNEWLSIGWWTKSSTWEMLGNHHFHPFKTGSLEFQVPIIPRFSQSSDRWEGFSLTLEAETWRLMSSPWMQQSLLWQLGRRVDHGIWWPLDSPTQHKDHHDRCSEN